MDKDDVLKLSDRTGIAAEQIVRWHVHEGPLYVSRNPGRPKGKTPRPAGFISIGDAVKKYQIKAEQIRKWRAEGLQTLTVGRMIAIRESELRKLIRQKH